MTVVASFPGSITNAGQLGGGSGKHASDYRSSMKHLEQAIAAQAQGALLRTIQGDVLSTIDFTMCFQPLEPPPAHVLCQRTPVATRLLVQTGLL